MQIVKDIYPGSPKLIDGITKGDTVTWTLNCKYLLNGTPTALNLTGYTNYLGILRDSIGNPCTAMTDATSGSNITVSSATNGVLSLVLTGSWTLPFQPGNWTLELTTMNGSNLIVLGKLDIHLAEQVGLSVGQRI